MRCGCHYAIAATDASNTELCHWILDDYGCMFNTFACKSGMSYAHV